MTDEPEPPASGRYSQLALLREQVAAAPPPQPAEAAEQLPVARVAVDVPLAHLDRPFDYLVPASMSADAVPGCRVSVRFAGKQTGGFVLERAESSEHAGRLGRIAKVVSPEVVLRPDVARAARSVADRYAGTFADVVRLAVPPRHARTERLERPEPDLCELGPVTSDAWAAYDGGREWVEALAAGASPRRCWAALPAPSVEQAVAEAVRAVVHSGRGAIVCAPDVGEVRRLDAALAAALGPGRHVCLTAELGPAARYRAFLALSRGEVQVAVGTRAAAFAPVHDLGLVAIWDDGDDLFSERRAPYPHAREVLLTRALDTGCAVLIGGYARTCEAQQLVESGWCEELSAPRATRRERWGRVSVAGGADSVSQGTAGARLPPEVFGTVRAALTRGPVLLQVPRLGYLAVLTCQRCRSPARCGECSGPLYKPDRTAPPRCRWCGRGDPRWECPECGAVDLRAPVVGERRTAEEIGRAFPRTVVRTSSGDTVLHSVGPEPALVVATPGAEPVAEGGFAAVVLLDTWVMLGRADLRTSEESLRRWLNAAARLSDPDGGGPDGGGPVGGRQVLAVGDSSLPVLQALVRADAVGHARRELADRRATRFPPAVRFATLEGPPDAVREAAAGVDWPQPVDLLGPVPTGSEDTQKAARLIVRVPRAQGPRLSQHLHALHAERSARKQTHLRTQVDPVAIG